MDLMMATREPQNLNFVKYIIYTNIVKSAFAMQLTSMKECV